MHVEVIVFIYKEIKMVEYNEEQYQMLKRCSQVKNIDAWNTWREQNPHIQISMQGADLSGCFLEYANLDGVKLFNANLQGTSLKGASLRSAHLNGVIVDGGTNFWKVQVNKYSLKTQKEWKFTDFSGVGLENAIIDPSTKQLIDYNIRRKYWHKWATQEDWTQIVKDGNIPRHGLQSGLRFVLYHAFFWVSDYGLSTKRILGVFFGLATIFALIYFATAVFDSPGIIENLSQIEQCSERIHLDYSMILIRSFYFSIVTMTTLGFGDMYASANSCWGHILLMVQVLIGYVLLGALVTRFAILFTQGGPAGEFSTDC
jgi:hypothetical protein